MLLIALLLAVSIYASLKIFDYFERGPRATTAAIQAVINSGSFIETVGDIAKVDFSGETGNQNPMLPWMTDGLGNFYFVSNATLNVLNRL